MSEPQLSPRSALAGLLVAGRHGRAGEPGVFLAEMCPSAIVAIAAHSGCESETAAALGLRSSSGCTALGAATFVWTGPGQWIAIAEGAPADLRYRLAAIPDGLATLTDLGGARAVLCIRGTAARRVLAKLLPVDVHPAAFGPGDGAATIAGHIPVLAWLTDDVAGFRVACGRSYAASMWHAVGAAAAEFGCEVAPTLNSGRTS